MAKKQPTYVAFIDLWKAFPSTNRAALLVQLHGAGVRGSLWRMLQEMGAGAVNEVHRDGHRSRQYSVESGLREGSVLSPGLFLVFINELIRRLNGHGQAPGSALGAQDEWGQWVGALCFADDIALVADSPEELQQMLAVFEQFCKDWHLKPNTSKSKVVVFEWKRSPNTRRMRGVKQGDVLKGRRCARRRVSTHEEMVRRWTGARIIGRSGDWISVVAVVVNHDGLTRLEIVEGDEAMTRTVTFGQLQDLAEIGFINQFRWDATTGRERIRDVGIVRDHAKLNPVEHKGKDRTYIVIWQAHAAIDHLTCVGAADSHLIVDPTTENEMSILEILVDECQKEDLGWWLWDERVLEVDDWPYLGIQMQWDLGDEAHYRHLKRKGHLAFHTFKSMTGLDKGKGVTVEHAMAMYQTYVESAILYGLEFCTTKGPSLVEFFQQKLAKWMLCAHRGGIPKVNLRRELGNPSA